LKGSQELAWGDRERKIGDRSVREILRRTEATVEAVSPRRLRPEAGEGLGIDRPTGERENGLRAPEVEQNPGEVEDQDADERCRGHHVRRYSSPADFPH
jgi:hypothetical protein